MNIASGDPYAVSNEREINTILRRLASDHILLRLDVPGRAVSFISTLLTDGQQASGDEDHLILDGAPSEFINAQLPRFDTVRVEGMVDHVKVEFSGRLNPTTYDGKPAFTMARPAYVRRLQRREFYRVDVPLTEPAHCAISSPMLASEPNTVIATAAPSARSVEPTTFKFVDLSVGGAKLLDDDGRFVEVPIGTFFDNCVLNLPGSGELKVHMRFLRISSRAREDGRLIYHAAFCYADLSGDDQCRIQRYVDRVERIIIARRGSGSQGASPGLKR